MLKYSQIRKLVCCPSLGIDTQEILSAFFGNCSFLCKSQDEMILLTSNQETMMEHINRVDRPTMAKTMYITTTTTTTITIVDKRTKLRGLLLSWELTQTTALDQLLQSQWVLMSPSQWLTSSRHHKCLTSIPSLSDHRFKQATQMRMTMETDSR